MSKFLKRALCVFLALSTPLLYGCQKPAESAQSQEEFQTEFVEMLKELDVFVTPESREYLPNSKIVTLEEGVEIYEDELIINMHVYEISQSSEVSPPTVEEIENLYTEYNDRIYKQFYPFYNWYTDVGSSVRSTYESALIIANGTYKDKNGHYFFQQTDWRQWTREERFELEEYVKNNPDYNEMDSAYQVLLKWLGVEKPQSN